MVLGEKGSGGLRWNGKMMGIGEGSRCWAELRERGVQFHQERAHGMSGVEKGKGMHCVELCKICNYSMYDTLITLEHACNDRKGKTINT